MFLESGVMNAGVLETTMVGSPQGGVISPLLANIYLDNFDQFMMARGHRIVRYADDILIFKTSKAGAENALKIAGEYLEKELKLTVNRRKTHLTSLKQGVSYLGVEIHSTYSLCGLSGYRRKFAIKAWSWRSRLFYDFDIELYE